MRFQKLVLFWDQISFKHAWNAPVEMACLLVIQIEIWTEWQILKNNYPISEQSGNCVALRYLLNEEESGMNFRDFFAMSESVWIEGSKKNSSVALQCNCQTFDLLSLQPSKHPLCTLWGCAAFFYLYVHHLGLNQSHNRKGSVQLKSKSSTV